MTPRSRQGPSPGAIAAIILLGIVVVAAVTIFAVTRDNGGGSGASGTTGTEQTGTETGTAPTTTALPPLEVLVYFVRDGRVGAAARAVPHTDAVARAALERLFLGPTQDEQDAGLTTEVPDGVRIETLAIDGGHGHVQLSKDLTPLARAQVVFTLTQFPTVQDVVVATPSGTSKPLTRTALEDFSPAILVEQPTPGDTVTSPLTVSGTANTFEATLQLELTDVDGNVLVKRFLTATSGNGTRGTFSGQLHFQQPAAGTGLVLTAYEDSAENGQRIHIVRIPLVAG